MRMPRPLGERNLSSANDDMRGGTDIRLTRHGFFRRLTATAHRHVIGFTSLR